MLDFFLYYTVEIISVILLLVLLAVLLILLVTFREKVQNFFYRLGFWSKVLKKKLPVLLHYSGLIIMALLRKITNVQPLLNTFKSGTFIKKTMSFIIRLVSVLSGLWFIYIWIITWQNITDLTIRGMIATVIWQLFFPLAWFIAMKVLYLQGREIGKYPPSDYAVVPIIATLIKTIGQIILIFSLFMGIPLMIMIWVAGTQVAGIVPFFVPLLLRVTVTDTAFVWGLLALGYLLASGYLSLLFFQYIAEWTLALFSIANDVNILRRHALDTGKGEPPENTIDN